MSFLSSLISSRNAFFQVSTKLNQVRFYAARKGTRLKAQRKKKMTEKVEKEAKSWVTRLEEKRKKTEPIKFSKLGSSVKDDPVDDVYFMKFYKYRTFTVENAVEMHKETHHETIYNQPDAYVYARMELDMSLYKKKNKCLDAFRSHAYFPHNIQFGKPYKVAAICERPEDQEAARAAGAYIVADTDFVQQLQAGEVASDFDYCVTTPDLITKLVPIRGILNRRFPNPHRGNIGVDVGKMVAKFANSIEYKVQTNKAEPSYALVEVPIGKLTTPLDHIEENLAELITDVCAHKSIKIGPPIIRLTFLTCPPTKEKFKIDHHKYLPEPQVEEDEEYSDEEQLA